MLISVGSTRCPNQFGYLGLCTRLDVARYGTDLLPLSRADVKNVWIYVPTPHYITLAQCKIQKRNDLTSYLIQGKVCGSDAVSVVQAVLQNFCYCCKSTSGLLWYGYCSDTFKIVYKNVYILNWGVE